jgi:hypothetical protein
MPYYSVLCHKGARRIQEMGALFLILLWIVSGVLASSIASTKGWSGFSWFVAGFLFGPLGLIAAAGMPDRRLRVYLRHLATEQGWTEQPDKGSEGSAGEGADAQRRRILGGKS